MPGLLSGVLPYVFSQGDRAKRYVTGLLADPVGTLQQTAGAVQDAGNYQRGLLGQAFADPQKPFLPTDRAALDEASNNVLGGVLGFAPAGITVFRAGAPKGMTADAGGPTFYATEKRGAEPFARNGEIKQYDIDPKAVLDTQLPRYRALYEQFVKDTGSPAGYGNTARPYWTAEYAFRNWLDKNGHKFDAVMFDEPTGVPSFAVYGR